MSDDKQRATMAAHLYELNASALRSGTFDVLALGAVVTCARAIVEHGTPERDYRHGLGWAGLTPEQIAAAVAAIERGEWPDTSLVGQVRHAMQRASGAQHSAAAKQDAHHAAKLFGETIGLCRVLDLLGVKP